MLARATASAVGRQWLNARRQVVAVHAGAHTYVGQDKLEYCIAARGVLLGRHVLQAMLIDLIEHDELGYGVASCRCCMM